MKRSIFLAMLVVTFVSASSQDEQKTFKFGLGSALSLPAGDLKTGTSYGIGFEMLGDYNFSENFSGFFQAGVDVFKGNSGFGDEANLLNIPLILGVRIKTNGFFAGAGAGYGLWSGNGGSSNGFLYSPQVGYEFENYQVMGHYTSTAVKGGSLSYFGIKLFRTF